MARGVRSRKVVEHSFMRSLATSFPLLFFALLFSPAFLPCFLCFAGRLAPLPLAAARCPTPRCCSTFRPPRPLFAVPALAQRGCF